MRPRWVPLIALILGLGLPALATAAPAPASPALYPATPTLAGRPVSIPGHPVTVTAVVRPWVPGQRVLLQAFEHGRLLTQRLAELAPSPRRVDGQLSLTVTAPTPGLIAVRLLHTASATLAGVRTEIHLAALAPDLSAHSPYVALIQAQLAARHLYVPATGVLDAGTQLALDAYHRLLGRGEGDVAADPRTVGELLDGAGAFRVRFPHQGRHAEGDLTTQLLALIDGDRVQAIFPISSGKPSTPTVLGSWRIYRQSPGSLPDGMYYSSFFTGGYAIHGFDPAPAYPASHGCMRLPVADAIPAYRWLTLGDWVDTYRSAGWRGG